MKAGALLQGFFVAVNVPSPMSPNFTVPFIEAFSTVPA
jgi:hypothetical protein